MPEEQLKQYYSHYIIVLDFDPVLDQVYILNTLPVSGGSGTIPKCAYKDVGDYSPQEAQLCVMKFDHFREALISDVQTVTTNLRNSGLTVNNQEATSIAIMHTKDE